MKTIYACKCGSTRLWRDAAQDVNDDLNVVTYDNVSCGECGYDGHLYRAYNIADDFELVDDRDFVHEGLRNLGEDIYL